MRKEVHEILRGHPFLKEFQPQHIDKLAEIAQDAHFERDQVVFRERDASSFFYLILSGKVALEVTALGRTIRVQTISDGEALGWSSVLPSKGKQFQARALGSVKALVFDGARLLELCAEDCTLGYTLMRTLLGIVADRLQATRVQLLDMYTPSGTKES
jgi:CRP/FNR family transcriptional regulator, cyclic AMP receptor protein